MSARLSTEENGWLVARAHCQAWRTDAPPFDLTTEELAAILPNLIKSGSAGIIWHRVKPFREKYGALAHALEAATKAQIAHNQRVEEAAIECVTRLRAYGIEPVLVKGLALAKLYPEGIVRPGGDIDLVVRKEQFAAAHAILHDSTKPPISVAIDLKHPGIWEEVPNADFWDRLESLAFSNQSVAVLSNFDNLQMVCNHFLKHGGMRPVWLCDYMLVVTSARLTSLVASLPLLKRSWHLGLVRVASSLVGPTSAGPSHQPDDLDWIVHSIFDQWLTPKDVIRGPAFTRAVRSPLNIPVIAREAWPTPIAATFYQRVPITTRRPSNRQRREYLRLFWHHLRHELLGQLRSFAQSWRN